jgi:hypothetical protein
VRLNKEEYDGFGIGYALRTTIIPCIISSKNLTILWLKMEGTIEL